MNREELLYRLKQMENIFSRFENTYNNIRSAKELQLQIKLMGITQKGTKVMGYIFAAVILLIPVLILDLMMAGIGFSLFPGWLVYFAGIYFVGRWLGGKITFVGFKPCFDFGLGGGFGAYKMLANMDPKTMIANAERQCEEIRREYAQMDVSWYPPSYQNADAARFFYEAFLNFRCETIGQAVNLYEDTLYKNESLRLQREQVALAFQQCILQQQTIDTIMNEGASIRNTIMNEGAAIRAQNADGFSQISGQLNGVSKTLDKIKKRL